jgi:putative hydrolase of the HAD superfamily
MRKPYRVVLFDCFNTLFLAEGSQVPMVWVDGKPTPSTAGLLAGRLAPRAPGLTAEQVYLAHREAWRWAEARRGEPQREVPAQERFGHMLRLLGIAEPEPDFVEELLAMHIDAVTGSYVLPEAHRALLERLARRHRLALFSNFDYAPGLRRLLRRHSVGECFDPIVISSEIGYRKPGRAAFERALALVGEPQERVLFVGDSLDDDVAGAEAIGLDVAWLNREDAPLPEQLRPIFVLRALEELEALLR